MKKISCITLLFFHSLLVGMEDENKKIIHECTIAIEKKDIIKLQQLLETINSDDIESIKTFSQNKTIQEKEHLDKMKKAKLKRITKRGIFGLGCLLVGISSIYTLFSTESTSDKNEIEATDKTLQTLTTLAATINGGYQFLLDITNQPEQEKYNNALAIEFLIQNQLANSNWIITDEFSSEEK